MLQEYYNPEEVKTTEKLTESVNPATGEVTGYTPENSVEELNEAVIRARAAQKEWAAKGYAERREYLLKIRDFITDNSDQIASVISRDTGKTRVDALSTEVLPTTMAISYYANKAGKLLKRKKISGGSLLTLNKRSYIDRVPFGVVGIISPWNYPFAIPFHEVAMALITGNAVILKVASQTLGVGRAISKAVEASGLPEGIFTLINLPGRIAGDAFIESGINKLFFTGSVPVGKQLMRKAAEKLIPVSLELGGNDAMIVLKDADLERASGGALWAGLSNAGQSCAAVERIYVEEACYDEFTSLLKNKLMRLRQGADTDFNVEIGSLTTKGQLETVRRHFEDAVSKGAYAFTGQTAKDNPKGLFHPPVIFENVNESMLCMQEETFGPLLALSKVKNLDEAVKKANDSNLGLTASVWTRDKEIAHRAASLLEAGAVTINDHLMSHGLAETPWGGFKQSGIERTHSYLGLEAMTQPRAVVDDILPGAKRNMWWYPHNASVYEGLKGAIDFLYSKDLNRRFNGMVSLIKTFMRTFSKNPQ